MSKPERYSSAKEYEIEIFREKVITWYRVNRRKFPWRNKSISIYQKVVSEVLLQRTRAETVASFFPAFVRRFPSWKSLVVAPEKELRKFLQPIGLWQRRARSLKNLAREMVKTNGRFSANREELESLPGVGQYIANAILMLCHREPQPLLDVNMARVIERHFGARKLSDIRYDPYLQEISKLIVSCDYPLELNWAILDLAAIVCKASVMMHDVCPVRSSCRYVRERSI